MREVTLRSVYREFASTFDELHYLIGGFASGFLTGLLVGLYVAYRFIRRVR